MECEVRQRLFIENLYRDISNPECPDKLIVVSHGLSMSLLRKALINQSVEDWESQPHVGNCGVLKLILTPGCEVIDAGLVYGSWETGGKTSGSL